MELDGGLVDVMRYLEATVLKIRRKASALVEQQDPILAPCVSSFLFRQEQNGVLSFHHAPFVDPSRSTPSSSSHCQGPPSTASRSWARQRPSAINGQIPPSAQSPPAILFWSCQAKS